MSYNCLLWCACWLLLKLYLQYFLQQTPYRFIYVLDYRMGVYLRGILNGEGCLFRKSFFYISHNKSVGWVKKICIHSTSINSSSWWLRLISFSAVFASLMLEVVTWQWLLLKISEFTNRWNCSLYKCELTEQGWSSLK